MSAERARSVAVAITGASGALYAVRTLAALLAQSSTSNSSSRITGAGYCGTSSVKRRRSRIYGLTSAPSTDRASKRAPSTCRAIETSGPRIASGSHGCSGMVIVPCSMKTLAGVAHGLSRNLIERAADVMLKERRPLIIVPRETPMSLPQLKNMVLCAEAGAMILPAMPAFYQLPKNLDDLADFMAGKILSALGFDHELYPAWTGRVGPS